MAAKKSEILTQKLWEQPVKTPRVTLDGNCLVTVEGYQQLLTYQPDEIALVFKQVVLHIYGDHLCIQSFSKQAVSIQGVIARLVYQEVDHA